MSYDPKENYCSSSPDVIFGVTINYGCYLHDRHYRNERKERYTRLQADRLLRNCIYRDLKNSNVPFQIRSPRRLKLKNYILFRSNSKTLIYFRKNLAYPTSQIYYLFVRLFGKKFWVNAP